MTIDIQTEVEEAATYWASEQQRSSHDVPLSVLVITEDGQRVLIGFAGGMSDALRPVLGQAIRAMVQQPIEAYIAVMVGWTSTRTDVRPMDDPERGEVLVIFGATRQGQSASRAYTMMRFGDEIRLQALEWASAESPTFQQILELEEEPA
jgi:hypothetical protein